MCVCQGRGKRKIHVFNCYVNFTQHTKLQKLNKKRDFSILQNNMPIIDIMKLNSDDDDDNDTYHNPIR